MSERAGERRLRLGFLGAGWIGLSRLKALLECPFVEVAAVADPLRDRAEAAAGLARRAMAVEGLEELLALQPDGLVIATPSAAHAAQAIRAIEAGIPVFCQKPLGRTAAETGRVIEAARRADVRLGVDFSYRHVDGARRIRDAVRNGEAGEIFAAELVFHNAYGPDPPWYYRAGESGGGCVMDLGSHLIDLLFWTLGLRSLRVAASRLLSGGRPFDGNDGGVEDYAVAQLELDTGAVATISCSWRLAAGRDAVIAASFYGTAGGLALGNVDGSFYRFAAEHLRGTARERLGGEDERWPGRAAVAWAEALSRERGFDPEADAYLRVAEAIDAVYGRGPGAAGEA